MYFFFRCFVPENKNRIRWNHVFDRCSIIIIILKLLGPCWNTNNVKEF
jgi:hypothetical protein